MSTSIDPGYFFQTNDSIAERERKQKKSSNKNGKPIKLESKLLSVLPAGPRTVFVAEAAGQVRVVDIDTGKIERTYSGATAPLTSLAISMAGDIIFAGCWDKSIHSWNKISRKPIRRYIGHSDFVKCVATCDLDGMPVLFSGSADATIIVWNIATGEKLHVIRGHTRAILDVRCDPVSYDLGKHREVVLFSSDSTRQIKRWRVSKDAVKEEGDPILAHQTSVNRICFDAPNGEDYEIGCWTASDDKTAQHLDRMRNYESDTVLQHPDFVRDLLVTPDGMYVVTACRDENIRVWDPSSGELQATFEGHFEEVTKLTLVFHEATYTLVSVSIDGTIRQWSMQQQDVLTYHLRAKTDEPGQEPEEEKPVLTAEEEAELLAMME